MKNWRSTILPPTTSIRDAMRTLDKGSLRICLVTDEKDRLLGTVTDGDIRRALLQNANMQDAIRSVMTEQPVIASVACAREQRLKLMNKNDLTAIPILDKKNIVVGLETLHQAMQQEQHDNPVFIMAGGFGTRLRPLTDHCPKPMLKVGGKPMLEHLINQFIQAGFQHFYVSTHYMPEVIKSYFKDGSQWGVNIEYVDEETPLGTGGALGLLPSNIPKLPLIMMNGDVLTKLDFNQLLQHHLDKQFDATMCVREVENQIAYGVIETDNQLITDMVEKPTYRYQINTGIYVLSPNCVAAVQAGEKIDLPSLLQKRIGDGHKVGVFTSYDYWLDIGQMKDYQKAQQDIEILTGDSRYA